MSGCLQTDYEVHTLVFSELWHICLSHQVLGNSALVKMACSLHTIQLTTL